MSNTDEPRIEVVSVPVLHDVAVLASAEERTKAKLRTLLTPEAVERIEAVERELEHRILFGGER